MNVSCQTKEDVDFSLGAFGVRCRVLGPRYAIGVQPHGYGCG